MRYPITQVTLPALGLFWAPQAAHALQQSGSLRCWLTGAPGHAGQGIAPSRVRFLAIPGYLRYGLERLLPGTWGQFTAMNVGDNLFDLAASRYAADCDV